MRDIPADHEFTFEIEAMLLPRVGLLPRNVNRLRAFRDYTLQSKALHLLNQGSEFCAELRIHSEGIREMVADAIEHLSSFLKRQPQSVTPLLVQDVEDVIHNGPSTGAAVLQFLKIRAPIFVQRDDLAIKHEISRAQSLQSEHNLAELRTVVLARHRVDRLGTSLDECDGAVSILLDLVYPILSFRKFCDTPAFHGLDETRLGLRIEGNTLHHGSFMVALPV